MQLLCGNVPSFGLYRPQSVLTGYPIDGGLISWRLPVKTRTNRIYLSFASHLCWAIWKVRNEWVLLSCCASWDFLANSKGAIWLNGSSTLATDDRGDISQFARSHRSPPRYTVVKVNVDVSVETRVLEAMGIRNFIYLKRYRRWLETSIPSSQCSKAQFLVKQWQFLFDDFSNLRKRIW